MLRDGKKPLRSWQEIAEEASHERDPEKLSALAKELEEALAERDKDLQTHRHDKRKFA